MPHPAYTYDHISSRKVRGRDNDMLSGEQTQEGVQPWSVEVKRLFGTAPRGAPPPAP